MTTITEAQNELEDLLTNQFGDRIPDDMADWDMEDWTIFALNFLRANIEDAVEFNDEDDQGNLKIGAQIFGENSKESEGRNECRHERLNDTEDACLDCGAIRDGSTWL